MAKIKFKLFSKNTDGEKMGGKELFLRLILPVGVVLILSAGVIAGVWHLNSKDIGEIISEISPEEEVFFERKLDGLAVNEKPELTIPYAIMIENKDDSRPPAGVSRASIIYEAPAEAGITRFLAIYDPNQDIEKIGPVRSARDYYLDWASPYYPLYAHVGGSPQSLAKIPQTNVYDLNEFYNWKYFWRAGDRYAPHNVYTSTDRLAEAIQDKEIAENHNFETWRFKDDRIIEDPGAQKIVVDFSIPTYEVTWQWTSNTNEYIRLHNVSQPHLDEDGTEIITKNIAVIATEAYVIDNEGRLKLRTTGKGKAWIFRDGEVTEGIWSKPDTESPLKFYDVTGRDIELNRGPTWVEVITSGSQIKWDK